MGSALIVEYYDDLPEHQGGNPRAWENRIRKALEKFTQQVNARYMEGTLHRLLASSDAKTRRATVLALGLVGTMKASNAALAGALRDEDRGVRQLAADALWALWFRAESDAHSQELQKLTALRDRRKKRAGLDALLQQAPNFAEAYNQRAILHFQMQEWQASIQDCQRVLKMNPYHFGAAAGMGRCYMELGKHKAALKAFRHALRINPNLDDVEEAIRALESALGEEGKRDDKK